MCDVSKKSKDKAEKDIERSRERLQKTIQKGEDKLCQYIHKLMDKHFANVISSDGSKNESNFVD